MSPCSLITSQRSMKLSTSRLIDCSRFPGSLIGWLCGWLERCIHSVLYLPSWTTNKLSSYIAHNPSYDLRKGKYRIQGIIYSWAFWAGMGRQGRGDAPEDAPKKLSVTSNGEAECSSAEKCIQPSRNMTSCALLQASFQGTDDTYRLLIGG